MALSNEAGAAADKLAKAPQIVEQLPGRLSTFDKAAKLQLQEAFVARRYRVTPPLAAVIASHAFGEART